MAAPKATALFSNQRFEWRSAAAVRVGWYLSAVKMFVPISQKMDSCSSDKSKHVRVGLYPSRVGPDGERKASVIKMDLTIETSDTKEQLLTYVEELKQCIIEHINENYDAFIVPDGQLP